MLGKCFLAAAVLAAALALPLFAQEAGENERESSGDWTIEQIQEYAGKALTVSVNDVIKPARDFDQYDLQWYPKAYQDSTNAVVGQDWTAYRGEEKISKNEFVEIAGDEQMLKKLEEVKTRIKSKRKSGEIWLGCGIGGVVAGAALLVTNSLLENQSGVLNGIGWGLAAASLVPVGIGIFNLRYNEDVDISADIAMSMANDYNMHLESSLRVGF